MTSDSHPELSQALGMHPLLWFGSSAIKQLSWTDTNFTKVQETLNLFSATQDNVWQEAHLPLACIPQR